MLCAAASADLILLDVHLNVEQNGWHILDVLGLDPVTRPVPVIVWSAASESLTAHAPVLLPKYGVYALPKPFDLDTLLDSISHALAAPLNSMMVQAREPLQQSHEPATIRCG
jgi:CheY-like chemotaxis protein